jgi:hypothetical protein
MAMQGPFGVGCGAVGRGEAVVHPIRSGGAQGNGERTERQAAERYTCGTVVCVQDKREWTFCVVDHLRLRMLDL